MATVKGGNALSQKLTEIAGKMAGDRFVRVGFLEGATYPATAGKHLTAKKLTRTLQGGKSKVVGSAGGKSVAMIAAIQEFGAPSRGIPPRPFFRNMIAARKNEWPSGIATQLKATNYDVDKTLARTGEAISGQLRQSIIDTNAPPLSPRTIAKKGFSKPLIDQGVMINSIDYEVT